MLSDDVFSAEDLFKNVRPKIDSIKTLVTVIYKNIAWQMLFVYGSKVPLH